MKQSLSRLRLVLLPLVGVILGVAMLAIPWTLPLGAAPERIAVFMIAGVVELALGVALAYIVLHEHR
jgi:hypothetical protein